jgi:hypothetical protein
MGKVGEAVLFLTPSERGYLGNLEARGVQLRPLNVLPALDLLPADSAQQVTCLQAELLCTWGIARHLPVC